MVPTKHHDYLGLPRAPRKSIKFFNFLRILQFRSFISSQWVALGKSSWLLFERASSTRFPFKSVLCWLSSRWNNLSFKACKFCCWKVLPFNNSLEPCILRLTYDSWKPDNASGCEVVSGTLGLGANTGVYHALWEGWSRYGCNGVSPITWSIIPWGGGGWGLVLSVWAAAQLFRVGWQSE